MHFVQFLLCFLELWYFHYILISLKILQIDLLNIYGVDDALVDLGGNVFVKGKNKDNLWKVGIQTPFGKQLESAGYIELSNKSIVTSGLYERGNHIINPINSWSLCLGESYFFLIAYF